MICSSLRIYLLFGRDTHNVFIASRDVIERERERERERVDSTDEITGGLVSYKNLANNANKEPFAMCISDLSPACLQHHIVSL